MEKPRDEQPTKKTNSGKLSSKLKRTSDSLKTQSMFGQQNSKVDKSKRKMERNQIQNTYKTHL
jgi:hypothetical protein